MEGKVFGIGLSRTGTSSLCTALRELGYRAATYRHLRRLEVNDWFKGSFSTDYLARYDAATDLPIATYFPDLDHRYPGSRFVLTIRDEPSWLESTGKHFKANQSSGEPGRLVYRDKVRLATYGVIDFSERRFAFVYQAHVRNVTNYFKSRPTDLLVLNICGGEGWEKLCPFLGKDIPENKFPWIRAKAVLEKKDPLERSCSKAKKAPG